MASPGALMSGGVQVDITRLSTFLDVPDEQVAALSAMTEYCVVSILQAVLARANEFDDLKADKLKLDVELEQCVRTADSRVRSMKGQLDSALAETQELRLKVSNTGLSAASSSFFLSFLFCMLCG